MFNIITGLIQTSGALGVFLLMLVENLFPPIPSEIIMPLAGFEAAAGRMSFLMVVVAGTVGSVLGALVWYWLGRWLGLERLARWAQRHGRWLTLSPAKIRHADRWFQRFGPFAVCLGRTLPGLRGVICIPAGVAGMAFWPFLASCTLGSLIWCILLTWAGFQLRAHYALVGHLLNPVTTVFLIVCLAIYAYRVATFRAPQTVGRAPTVIGD